MRRVPVTDDQGHLVGLVSLSDVVQAAAVAPKGKAAARTAVVETLGTLSRPRREAAARRFAEAPKAPQPKAAKAPRTRPGKTTTRKATSKASPKQTATKVTPKRA